MADAIRVQTEAVELTFGALISWMGATHNLTKTSPKASTEMSLRVLAYNFNRLLNPLGTQSLTAAIRT